MRQHIKYLKILLFAISVEVAHADEDYAPIHRQTVKGESSYSLYGASILCKLEEIGEIKENLGGQKEDLLVLYDKSKSPEEPIVKIEEAWGDAIHSPKFVHAKLINDELVVLLHTRFTLDLFLRQRYKKENGKWVLKSENPIQKMDTSKSRKLVAAEVTGRNEVTFYFHSYAEISKIGQQGTTIRKIFEGQPHKDDYRLVYTFTDWTEKDKLDFKKSEIPFFPEVLGDRVKLNGEDYDFVESDSRSAIPGYKLDDAK